MVSNIQEFRMTLRDPVAKKISQARIKLLFTQPFFGNLTMHLRLQDATDAGWCPTAAVDGRNIYYNRNFFGTLDVEEIVFVLCHEVLHVAFDHFGRRSHRDRDWWNMANDYVINALLVQEKIGKMPMTRVPDTNASKGKGETAQRVGLYDAKYVGWSSESVYDDLEKRKVKKELTMDVHIDMGDDAKGGKAGDKDGAGKIPVEIDSDELKKIKEEIKGKILQAANAAAGKMPASIQRLIDDLVEPKINWRDLLQQNIQSCIVDDFTWTRPNRKHMYSGIFLPVLDKDETIDIQIAIDTSGSITDEMARDFISEIHGMMGSYQSFTIGIMCFDTTAYNYHEFTQDNADDILTYEVKGGGGTDFMAFWNFWKDNNIEPKKAIVFTDGYPFGTWGPENYCDVLWIITDGAKTRVKPPFGSWAYYSSKEGVEEVEAA